MTSFLSPTRLTARASPLAPEASADGMSWVRLYGLRTFSRGLLNVQSERARLDVAAGRAPDGDLICAGRRVAVVTSAGKVCGVRTACGVIRDAEGARSLSECGGRE